MKKWMILVSVLAVVIGVVSAWSTFNEARLRNLYVFKNTLSGDGCLVLAYHRIRPSHSLVKTQDQLTRLYAQDAELNLYTVYQDEFKEQLNYLLGRGFQFVTPDELYRFVNRKLELPPKCAMVTFDDVDVSVYKNAFPFLVEKQIPFTLFLITGEVGNRNFKGLELATWSQIRDMQHSGLATIGTHTHRMHQLDKNHNPPFLDPSLIDSFVQDARSSFQTVQDELGFKPTYFAYPYGFGTPETDKALLELGYKSLFSLSPGLVEQGAPSFFMKRVLISRYSWPAVVKWLEHNEGEAQDE